MSLREPPALATWLLQHLGSGYHGESLAGDLFEEYQLGRSRLWYWRQTAAVIATGGARAAGLLLGRVAASIFLRFLTEAAALLGVLALAQQTRQFCSIQALFTPSALITVVGAIALVLSVGFYISLTVGRPRRRDTAPSNTAGRRQTQMQRRMAAFAVTALSAGTLTWASTSSESLCTMQSCACHGSATAASSRANPDVAIPDTITQGAVATEAATTERASP
jgi:hypothetical protein